MIVIAAAIAGLFLILKELIPLLQAQLTGEIRTRGHRRVKVERVVEPERFKGLCRQRFRGMGLGLIVLGVGVLWVVWPIILTLMADSMAAVG